MISEDEIDRALAYLRDNAEKNVQTRADRLYLDKWLDVVLAQEQAKARTESVAAAKVIAESSEAYKAALEAWRQAVFDDEKQRFLRGAAETKIEVFRTEQANKRAEERGYR